DRSRLSRQRLRRHPGDTGGPRGRLQAACPHRRARPAWLRAGGHREDPGRQRAARAGGQRAGGREPPMSGRARVVVIEGEEAEPAALRPLALASPMARRPVADLGPGCFALKVITEEGSARVVRFAFELARRRKAAGRPGKLTCATKHNMLPATDGLFREVATRLAASYPDVRFETFIVDDFARRLVAEPQALDVVVLPNLY